MKDKKEPAEKKLSKQFVEAFKALESDIPMFRLSKDIKRAAGMMGVAEVRYLVDLYYQTQKIRITVGNQVDRCAESGEPIDLLRWTHANYAYIENDIKSALGSFAKEYSVGRWLQGICGIGPVLSAAFLCELDVRGCPTAGHWWSYAGLNPSSRWISSDESKKMVNLVMGDDKEVTDDHLRKCAAAAGRRVETIMAAHKFLTKKEDARVTKTSLASALSIKPWNSRVKVFCFKAGESFVKVKNNKSDVYGHLYQQRKDYEAAKNEKGDYCMIALEKASEVGKSTEAYKSYSEGKLPLGHLHNRARRWTVKMFLSHLHTICYRDYYNSAPPVPYVFSKTENGTPRVAGDHRHYIDPPTFEQNGKSLKELYREE